MIVIVIAMRCMIRRLGWRVIWLVLAMPGEFFCHRLGDFAFPLGACCECC